MAERPARVNGARDGVKAPRLGGGNGGTLPYLAVMRDAEWRPWGAWFVRFVRFVRRIQHFVQNAGRGLADVAGDLVNRSVLGWGACGARSRGKPGTGLVRRDRPSLVRSRDSADLRGGAAMGGAGAVYRDTSEGPPGFAPASTKRRLGGRVGAGAAAFGLVPRLGGGDRGGGAGSSPLVLVYCLCLSSSRSHLFFEDWIFSISSISCLLCFSTSCKNLTPFPRLNSL